MYIERKEDLSVYYHIKDQFTDASYVVIEDSFPETYVELPTIAVDAGTLDHEAYELGNRVPLRIRKWFIHIFAKTKSQRDDFAYRILNSLDDGISTYDYDEGFPPDVSPSKIGHLELLKIVHPYTSYGRGKSKKILSRSSGIYYQTRPSVGGS